MPPEQPLLTIAIPTYNRAKYLAQLLESLAPQLKGRDNVELIISDNASEDETPSVVRAFRRRRSGLRHIRNETNIGPDRNILQCFEEARGKHAWIIGDDDVLLPGALSAVLEACAASPAIIYIASRSFKGEFQSGAFPAVARPRHRVVRSNVQFAKIMNVWATFISGIVVNKDLYGSLAAPPLKGLLDTNLIQLGWVLPLLARGKTFDLISSPLIASTADNTGGYRLATVFGTNFGIVAECLLGDCPRLKKALENALIMRFFPPFALAMRHTQQLSGLSESRSTLRQLYGHNPRFWLFLYPVLVMGSPAAEMAAFHTRMIARIDRAMGYPLL